MGVCEEVGRSRRRGNRAGAVSLTEVSVAGASVTSQMTGDSGHWSRPATSPPARVAIPAQTEALTEFFANRTEPSPNITFAPPGCRLLAAFHPYVTELNVTRQSGLRPFGVNAWLYSPWL